MSALNLDLLAARIFLATTDVRDESFRDLDESHKDRYRKAAREVGLAVLHEATTRLSDEVDALYEQRNHLAAAEFRNARERVQLIADEIVGVQR